jgi:hypothetical protein
MELLSLYSLFLLSIGVAAIGQQPTIRTDGEGLTLADDGSSVQIVADRGDWPAVLRVCDDLAMDFGRVTGVNGSVNLQDNNSTNLLNSSMIFNITGRSFGISSNATPGGTIIAGTIGRSSIVTQLVSEGKIDISGINGTWEAYVSMLVADPLPGISEAMVIVGEYKNLQLFVLR